MAKRHYVQNKPLLQALREYQAAATEAEEKGLDAPIIPDYIGRCIMLISERLATRGNFSGYSFKNEMIGDGIEVALKSVRKFDTEKYDNPHAYFSMVIWNAFIRRISLEKRETYTRMKISSLSNNSDIDNEMVSKFIEEYEEKYMTNVKKEKKTPTGGIYTFIEGE